ncbi:MAG: S-layer homology domain-containing protein [Candidatus Hodarchaeales archaeon]
MRNEVSSFFIVFLFVVLFFSSAIAKDLLDNSSFSEPANSYSGPQKAYGTTDQTITFIGADGVVSTCSTTGGLEYDLTQNVSANPGCGNLWQSLNLPTGVLVDAIELEACDTSDSPVTGWMQLFFFEIEKYPSFESSSFGPVTSGDLASDTPGCDVFTMTLSPPVEIDNNVFSYFLVYRDGDGSNTTKFRGSRIFWRRQASPAPGTATFPDVGTGHWAFQFIEALVSSGVVSGKPDGMFHPNDPITRAEMSKLIAQLLGVHWPN